MIICLSIPNAKNALPYIMNRKMTLNWFNYEQILPPVDSSSMHLKSSDVAILHHYLKIKEIYFCTCGQIYRLLSLDQFQCG